MRLGKVRARILIAGAWLTGAGVATASCLYAVSLLGQGILGTSSQQLTVAVVNRALASEPAEAAPSPSPSPATTPRRTRTPRPPASPAAGGGTGAGTLLTSSGGSVVAGCAGPDAYLLSWSPQQGYEAVAVVRGPAPQAQVTFRAGAAAVIVAVTCHGGVPAATATAGSSRGDDGS